MSRFKWQETTSSKHCVQLLCPYCVANCPVLAKAKKQNTKVVQQELNKTSWMVIQTFQWHFFLFIRHWRLYQQHLLFSLLSLFKGEQRAYQYGFLPTLVYPFCYLSFSSQCQPDINPAREHKKWAKSPSMVKPHSEGILVACKTRTYTCVRERLYKIERLHDWDRWKLLFFFFFLTLVLNWFCCLLPSNHNPLWKPRFLAQNITKDISTLSTKHSYWQWDNNVHFRETTQELF